MKAGRELDTLIAEKVMGFPAFAPQALGHLNEHVMKDYVDNSPCIVCGRRDDTNECLPHYSTDIASAWKVVEKLRDDKFSIEEHGTHWKVHFGPVWRGAETAPHAICLAALEAVALAHPARTGAHSV